MSNHKAKYYYKQDNNPERFYQTPKELLTHPIYRKLSSNAKILYSVLLDRKELSRKNNWVEEDGRIYLIYPREDLAELLNVSKRTIISLFNQLREVDLVEEESQKGHNQPNKIYVLKLDIERGEKISLGEVKKFHPSDTNYSDTEIINNFKEKPLKVIPLNNQKELKEIMDEESALIVNQYAKMYEKIINVKHPNLKENQLKSIDSKILSFNSEFGLSVEDWKDLIFEYFNVGKIGDGNINRFFYGDTFEGVIRGMLC